MDSTITIEQQLETFRDNFPGNKNNIQKVVLVGKNGNEVLGLEIYSPPILLEDNLRLSNQYIRRLKLNLVAKKETVNSYSVSEKK